MAIVKKQPSMPQPYCHPNDEWVVKSGNEDFVLSGEELELLRQATLSGKRGIIWFKKFAISIPHISCIFRTKSGKREEDPTITKLRKAGKL